MGLWGGVPGPLHRRFHLTLSPGSSRVLVGSESRCGKPVLSWEGPGKLAEASHASYEVAKVSITMEM